jgi:O-antigen/teichoic acid export membrane protein
VKHYIDKVRLMATSSTARDTYVLFFGNLGSAFWGFVFTLIVARALSVSDFGIFSAVLNLVVILSSLSDVGISTGSTNFVASHFGKGDEAKADDYIKASLVVRVLIIIILSVIVFSLAPVISSKLLATNDPSVAVWAGVLTIFIFPVMFSPSILQAKRKFLMSTVVDNSFYLARLLFILIFYFFGALTMKESFWAFGVGFLVAGVLTIYSLGTKFLFAKPHEDDYRKLIKFSGWLAVNRIISSVSGRLDIQMLAAMVGAVATGLYSIPSRLASFLIVLAGSYSSVLATRFASFGDSRVERQYLFKSTLALIPIIAGVILWIIFARPFMEILFGEKYLPAVPVFQALAAAQIPFLLTVPPVTAIIYAMKKTVYIGTLSFFQLAAIFLLNLFLIPRFGILGPTMTFGVTNTLLALYVWIIVLRHYNKVATK